MTLTPRQAQFVAEYLIDRNAMRAARVSAVTLLNVGRRYYVYFLIDSRDGSIFYVGKGKGDRLWEHRRVASDLESVNQVKASRIRECGESLMEAVFADDMDEVSALALEKELIVRLRHSGLTNITSGIVHPAEAALASIDHGLSVIKTYEEWLASARLDQLEAARQLRGSTEAFYDDFIAQFEELRADALRRLNSIKGISGGTTGR